MSLSACFSVSLSVSLSFCLSVCLSIHLSDKKNFFLKAEKVRHPVKRNFLSPVSKGSSYQVEYKEIGDHMLRLK